MSLEAKIVYTYNRYGKLINRFESIRKAASLIKVDSTIINKRIKRNLYADGLFYSEVPKEKWDKKTKELFEKFKLETKQIGKKEVAEVEKKLHEIQKIENTNQFKQAAHIKTLESTITHLRLNEKEYKSILTEQEKKINFLEGISGKEINLVKWKIDKSKGIKREAIAIGCYSDSHCGERVDKRVTNGLNEYNLDICTQRTKIFFQKYVKLIHKERKDIIIKKGVIGLLGDLITGYIHEELRQNNYLSPIEETLFMCDLLVNGLKFVADNSELEELTVVCKMGNHGRNTSKKTIATGYKNSYEWMLYHTVKKTLEMAGYNKIKFIIEEGEFTYLTLYDKVTRWCHGDHFNYKGGVAGVEIPLKTWLYKMNQQKRADMTFMAHWHTYMTSTQCTINGSIMGLNAYAIGFGANDSRIMQNFQLLDSELGFTINAPIFLNNIW